MVDLSNYLIVGVLLFCVGLVGFLARRNMITMFLSAELMVQGVALNFLAFSRFRGTLQGQSFVLFIISVAACEAAIALALIVVLYRMRKTLDVSEWQELREEDLEPTEDVVDEFPTETRQEPLPKLTIAGYRPVREEESSNV